MFYSLGGEESKELEKPPIFNELEALLRVTQDILQKKKDKLLVKISELEDDSKFLK